MTWQTIVAAVLLIVGIGVELLACLGLLVMTDLFDRLHYLGPAAALGPVAVAAAVLFVEGGSTAGIKAILIAAVLVGIGPVLTHATARAARVRRFGHWNEQPDEHIEEC